MNNIESIILQNSARGMDVLKDHLSETFCSDAAKAILGWDRGTVLVTTGFYVAGHAETDGPPGTLFVCRALEKCGFVKAYEGLGEYQGRVKNIVKYFFIDRDQLLKP